MRLLYGALNAVRSCQPGRNSASNVRRRSARPAHPCGPPHPRPTPPKHLAERIINSKAALEGERKQVTVLFADLKGSMELLADRDPEERRARFSIPSSRG